MRATELDRRQRRRQRGAIRLAVVLGIVAVLAVGVGVFALTRDGGGSARATPTTIAHAPVITATVPTAPPAPVYRAAAAIGRDIPIYANPDPSTAPIETLSQQTDYGLNRTLLVFDTATPNWVHVYLPTRPNNSTGWVKTSDVSVSQTPLDWQVQVDLGNHQATLLHDGQVDFTTTVAIGSPEDPTPTGTFFITDPIDLRNRPGTGYGAYALGLSGHSDVLTSFEGGDGQIALHGTDNSSDVGQSISHGCVRFTNDDILRLSSLPLGTPVFIH